MSTVQNNQATWTNLAGQQLDSKYEKCRNITEEIYKRINITFQIKKLETGDQSDISVNSDQIDSNELSNETDLFACDKSDISSSEAERTAGPAGAPAFININNNNEEKNKVAVYKRPRKRFRKRVKKRPPHRKRSDSEGSSDEAPLSRSVILSPDMKPKSAIEKEPAKKSVLTSKNLTLRELLKPNDVKVPTVVLEKNKSIDQEAVRKCEAIDKKAERNAAAVEKNAMIIDNGEEKNVEAGVNKRGKVLSMTDSDKKAGNVKTTEWKSCHLCSLSFRGVRGLRRHMSMSHITSPEGNK